MASPKLRHPEEDAKRPSRRSKAVFQLPIEPRCGDGRAHADARGGGFEAGEIYPAGAGELVGMDAAAGDQQAVEPGAVGAGDVGSEAVADRQDAETVLDPQQV